MNRIAAYIIKETTIGLKRRKISSAITNMSRRIKNKESNNSIIKEGVIQTNMDNMANFRPPFLYAIRHNSWVVVAPGRKEQKA